MNSHTSFITTSASGTFSSSTLGKLGLPLAFASLHCFDALYLNGRRLTRELAHAERSHGIKAVRSFVTSRQTATCTLLLYSQSVTRKHKDIKG